MKAKLIIVLLIGLLIGSLLGGVLVPAIASDFNWQLDEITYYLSKIYKSVSNIENRVNNIY